MNLFQESADLYGYSLGIRSADIFCERTETRTSKDTDCFYTLNGGKVIVRPGKSENIQQQLHLPLLHLRKKEPLIPIGPKWENGVLKIDNGLSLPMCKVLSDLTESFFNEFGRGVGREVCLAVSLPVTPLIRCQLMEACEKCNYYVRSVIPKPEAYACDAFTEHKELWNQSNTIMVVVFDDLSIQPFKVTIGNGCITSDEYPSINYGYEWLQSKVFNEFLSICGDCNDSDAKRMEYIEKVDNYLQNGETGTDHTYDGLDRAVKDCCGKIIEYLKKHLDSTYPVVFCGFIHQTKKLKEYLCKGLEEYSVNNQKRYKIHQEIDPSAARGAVRFVKQNRKVLNVGIQKVINSPFKFGYRLWNMENVILEKGSIPLRPMMEIWRLRKPERQLRLTWFLIREDKHNYHSYVIPLHREVTPSEEMCFEVWTVDWNTIYYHVRIGSEILCPLTKIDICHYFHLQREDIFP